MAYLETSVLRWYEKGEDRKSLCSIWRLVTYKNKINRQRALWICGSALPIKIKRSCGCFQLKLRNTFNLRQQYSAPTGHFKSPLSYQYEQEEILMRTDEFLVSHPNNGANYVIFTQVGVQALILHIMVECGAVKENAPALFWNNNLDLTWEESKTWLKK